MRRLLRGEHLTLLGCRGSGKAVLLARLHSQLVVTGVPCAYSRMTTSLDDWCEHGLLVTALCVDTEAAVRHRALEFLRPVAKGADYPVGSEQSFTEGGSEASGLITPKQAGV